MNIMKMDEIDKIIVKLIQDEPSITHTQIAKRIKRSQPTVGQRLRKLEKDGIFKYQAGFNFKEIDMYFAHLHIQTKDITQIAETVKKCPYLLNAFRISGDYNLTVLLAAFSLSDLEIIANYHFRKNPLVLKSKLDIITEVVDDFIVPFNLNFDECNCKIRSLLMPSE